MSQWSEGYCTDMVYTHGYYRELSPAFQRFCLISHGIRPPMNAQPTYFEMGFGNGISLNLHAVSQPGMYYGNDFQPAHVCYAQGLAKSCGSTLVTLEDSFEQLLARDDLPNFDYIGLHGIWSWINKANQKHIVDFAQKKLKPGGVLYLSYNASPGKMAFQTVRHLMKMYDNLYKGSAKSNEERVRNALEFAIQQFEGTSATGNQNPTFLPMLKKLLDAPASYFTNEYFNECWEVPFFSQVAQTMAEGKLSYGASCYVLENMLPVLLPAEVRQKLDGITDPLLFEQVKDMLLSQGFRKDLFVKGRVTLNTAEQFALLHDMEFWFNSFWQGEANSVGTALGTINLQQENYGPMREFFLSENSRPKTFYELCQAMQPHNLDAQQVLFMVTILVGQESLHPCLPAEQRQTAAAGIARYNRACMENSHTRTELGFLASSITGEGVSVDRISQLFLYAMQYHADVSPVDYVVQVMVKNGESIFKNGQSVSEPKQMHADLTVFFQEMLEQRTTLFKTHGLM